MVESRKRVSVGGLLFSIAVRRKASGRRVVTLETLLDSSSLHRSEFCVEATGVPVVPLRPRSRSRSRVPGARNFKRRGADKSVSVGTSSAPDAATTAARAEGSETLTSSLAHAKDGGVRTDCVSFSVLAIGNASSGVRMPGTVGSVAPLALATRIAHAGVDAGVAAGENESVGQGTVSKAVAENNSCGQSCVGDQALVDTALVGFLRKVAAPSSFYQACDKATLDLIRFSRGGVVQFGSSVQRTATSFSDLDVKVDAPLDTIRDRLIKSASGFVVVEERLAARIPVLKLEHTETMLLVDVSRSDGCESDRLIRRDIEEMKCCDVVVLIKVWAKRRALVGAYEGFPSSYCWVSLTLYALRAYERSGRQVPTALSEAMKVVFRAVLDIDSQQPCEVSPMFGELLKRRSDLHGRSPTLVVEDVGNPSANVAAAVRPGTWRTCVGEARKALDILTEAHAHSVWLLFRERSATM